MRVAVHVNTSREQGFEEAVELLNFLEVDAFHYSDQSDLTTLSADLVVDRRMVGWRGWRDILSNLTWRYRDRMVEWHRMKDEQKEVRLSVQEEEFSHPLECET
jgi:hypothetical protein